MKKYLLGAAVLAVLAVPAMAADMRARPYAKAPQMPAVMAPIYNWTGFYVGGHVGGDWAASAGLDNRDGRFLGGVQGGFDYQFGQSFVVGLEGQYSWLNNNSTGGLAFAGNGLATQNTRSLGSATARLGWTWGPGLLYVKGGYAYRDTNGINVSVAGVPQGFVASGNRRDGYTVGAGLEYMFAPNWSAKAEYQYYDFGTTQFNAGSPPALVGASVRNDEHTVKVGVNYRFGWGGPEAARY